jgi:LacI family transcriptional regulator
MLAETLGVSPSTVSRVLSGQADKYRIAKDTQDAVLEAAEKFDYAPSRLARSLRLSKTHTLGLIIPDISNPFFSDIARHITIGARKLGYSIILCDSEESTEAEAKSVALLRDQMVDGLIVSPVGRTGAHLTRLYDNGMPLVVVDRPVPDAAMPYVTSDNYKGTYDGATYLIENGHRDIAFIQGIPDSETNVARIDGFKAALRDHGIALPPTFVTGDHFGETSGYIGAKTLLQKQNRPTALFTAGNLIALGAIRALAEEGVTVPHDMSHISFDEHAYSSYLSVPLTTIAQQTTELGQIAVELLVSQMERSIQHPPENIVLPTRLIVRESVRNVRDGSGASAQSGAAI